MIRIFEYNKSENYRDFENYVFTNLNNSFIDAPNDKITLDGVEYRLSSAIVLVESTDLKGRGNGFIIITDVPGAFGTIPTVANPTLPGWLDTDLYPEEKLVNTADKVEYMNYGGVIYKGTEISIFPPLKINAVETAYIKNSKDQEVILQLNKEIVDLTKVDILGYHGGSNINISVTSYAISSMGNDYVSVIIDASFASDGDTLKLRVTADTEMTDWSDFIPIIK